MQSCQEQPFPLQGDRNSGRAHGGPPALMRAKSALQRWSGSRPPCEAAAPRGSLSALHRRLHGTARPCPERGFAPGGAKDAQRVGEGTAADVPFAPGEAARRRVREDQGRSVPGQTSARVAGQTSGPSRAALRAPSSSPTDPAWARAACPAPSWLLPSSHRAPGGRDGAGCSRLPAPAASTRGRPSGSRPGPPLSSAGPWLPAPPRRSEPRRAAAWPASARGEQWTGRGGAGWGGAGRALGGRAAQRPGAEAARCARQAAGSGTEKLDSSAALQRGERGERGRAGRGRLDHGAPRAPPLGQAPPPGQAPPRPLRVGRRASSTRNTRGASRWGLRLSLTFEADGAQAGTEPSHHTPKVTICKCPAAGTGVVVACPFPPLRRQRTRVGGGTSHPQSRKRRDPGPLQSSGQSCAKFRCLTHFQGKACLELS